MEGPVGKYRVRFGLGEKRYFDLICTVGCCQIDADLESRIQVINGRSHPNVIKIKVGGVPSFLDIGGHLKFAEWNIIIARRKTEICSDETVHAIDSEVGRSENAIIGLIPRSLLGFSMNLLGRC